MSTRRILILQGHPDPAGGHLCHALAQAYANGARAAGHELQPGALAALAFPLLRSQADWKHRVPPLSLLPAQQAISEAQHLVLCYPLWLGDMPALMKAFVELVARPGFALKQASAHPLGAKGLTGRSAPVTVTLGMPARVCCRYFCAHSVQSLARNVAGFVGTAPVRDTLVDGSTRCA